MKPHETINSVCPPLAEALVRANYRELEPAADREDRDARLAFLAVRREQIYELWGRP